MATQVTLSLPVLRKGSTESPTVRRLQHLLNAFVGHGEEGHPGQPLKEDGVFGPKTEQAVKTLQAADAGELTVDGIVGQQTWTKLLTMWLTSSDPG
jgi:peptidoglycan hydrolase-like protein with peptidoglycan-binding domain